MTMLTTEQLLEIRKRADAATPIPNDMDCGDNSCRYASKKSGMRTNGGCRCLEGVGFSRSTIKSFDEMLNEVRHARQDIPALLSQIEALQNELEKALSEIKQLKHDWNRQASHWITDRLTLDKKLKVATEALNKISRRPKIWRDKGHHCDSKVDLEAVANISSQALVRIQSAPALTQDELKACKETNN